MSTTTGAAEQRQMTASELFAIAKSARCEGKHFCHWCGAPCTNVWTHDDEPRMFGQKAKQFARRPGDPYVCVGCWVWRYRSVTVPFLSGGYKDGQAAHNHSWWITEEGAWAITEDCYPKLRELLLFPPERWCLSLLSNDNDLNHIQLMVVNNHQTITADMPLHFTVGGTREWYTIYELDNAMMTGETNGKSAGTRTLIERLHFPLSTPEKRGPGRPAHDPKKDPRRVVRGEPATLKVEALEDEEDEE